MLRKTPWIKPKSPEVRPYYFELLQLLSIGKVSSWLGICWLGVRSSYCMFFSEWCHVCEIGKQRSFRRRHVTCSGIRWCGTVSWSNSRCRGCQWSTVVPFFTFICDRARSATNAMVIVVTAKAGSYHEMALSEKITASTYWKWKRKIDYNENKQRNKKIYAVFAFLQYVIYCIFAVWCSRVTFFYGYLVTILLQTMMCHRNPYVVS